MDRSQLLPLRINFALVPATERHALQKVAPTGAQQWIV
jgi:hypothetical protein